MDEEKKTEFEETKTGLDLSDTQPYDLWSESDDGSFDEDQPKAQPEKKPEKKKEKKSGGHSGVAAFTTGFITCLAVLFFLTYGLGMGRFLSKQQFEYYQNLSDKYGKYEEILQLIEDDPLAEHDGEVIDDQKLKDLVSSIGDPYAEYYTAEEYKEFRKLYLGDYVGIGVAVTTEDGRVVIKSIMEDSPAEDAGLMAEDVIKAVDGKVPADVDDAIDMISGEAGTKVELTIDRGGKEMNVSVTRAEIEAQSVFYTRYGGDTDPDSHIGYIAITSFRDDTAKDFKDAVKDLESQGCDKFIIDLRGNGGGLTDVSIDIADYLLPECRIMTEYSKNGNEKVYNSKASSAGIDYVVLVDRNTASASEILSAAIQDNHGGLIIGEKTYGKGVTQISRKFNDGSAIKITSTEYYRPNGGKVNGVGITPDIEVEGDDAVLEKALEELKK